MAIDSTTANAHLDAWVAADLALAGGAQSYTISTATGSRTLTRSNAAEIREQIAYWQAIVNRLSAESAGGNRRAAIATWS